MLSTQNKTEIKNTTEKRKEINEWYYMKIHAFVVRIQQCNNYTHIYYMYK